MDMRDVGVMEAITRRWMMGFASQQQSPLAMQVVRLYTLRGSCVLLAVVSQVRVSLDCEAAESRDVVIHFRFVPRGTRHASLQRCPSPVHLHR